RYGGRDKRSAALGLAGDQSHCQPGAALLAIHVYAKRAYRASARARLLGPEKAKKHATAAAAPGQRESAGRAEIILQCFTTNVIGIISRLRCAPHQSAHFSGGRARQMGLGVAEILRDRGILFGDNAVIVSLPTGIEIERFAFYVLLSGSHSGEQSRRDKRSGQQCRLHENDRRSPF